MKKMIVLAGAILAIAFVATLFLPTGKALAQQGQMAAPLSPAHLNPAVIKLAAGQPMIGLQTGDMSLQNCHSIARVNYDYVYFDLEHNPLNFESLGWCVAAWADKTAALKSGSAAPKVALFARFPSYGRDQDSNDWVIKQALDIGLMGIIFNGVDNSEQMTRIIQEMRYPQKKNAKYPQPPGMRGYSPTNALFAWGIPGAEYERRADVWPLNPDGDLMAIPQIETLEGLKNADAIASVPGVSAIFLGAGGDLHQYLGVDSANSPETEEARQTVLKACKAHHVACGITAGNKEAVDRRLKEGWMMIRTGAGE